MGKYFVERLIAKNVNLDEVLPEQQKSAQNRNNVTYNLADVVMYMKDATENFKIKTAEFIDMDEAIREIMKRYYKSKNISNPFELPEEEQEDFEGETPKEPLEVKDGKTTAKGAPKAAPVVKAPTESAAVSDEQKIENLKAELERRKEVYSDVYDEVERAEFLDLMKAKMEAHELLADENSFSALAIKVYENYVKELENIK
jgi:hypothetical protein